MKLQRKSSSYTWRMRSLFLLVQKHEVPGVRLLWVSPLRRSVQELPTVCAKVPNAYQELSQHTSRLKPFGPPAHVLIIPSRIPLDLTAAVRGLEEDGLVRLHLLSRVSE